MPPSNGWAERRSEAAREHQARLEARLDAEHHRAEEMLGAFARAARRAGLAPEPLRVQGYRPSHSARTALRGWYLRKDRKAGMDTEGNFYLLLHPLGLRDRVRGLTPPPSRPPLVLGSGGRDGNSITLTDALERLLPGWNTAAAGPPSG